MSPNPMATCQSLTSLVSIATFNVLNFALLEMFSFGLCNTTLLSYFSYFSCYFFIDSSSSAKSLNIGVSQEPDLGLLPFSLCIPTLGSLIYLSWFQLPCIL